MEEIQLSKKNGTTEKNSTSSKKRRFDIRLSESEFDDFTMKAEKAGLTKSALMRRAVKGLEVKEAPPVDVRSLIVDIIRVGNNLNQIAVVANAQQLVDVPLLHKTIDEVQTALKAITQAYAMEV